MKKLFEMKDELNARLTALAKEKGMTKTGMLNLVVEKGLAYYEKKQFASQTQEPYSPQPQKRPTSTPIQPQLDRKEIVQQPQRRAPNGEMNAIRQNALLLDNDYDDIMGD